MRQMMIICLAVLPTALAVSPYYYYPSVETYVVDGDQVGPNDFPFYVRRASQVAGLCGATLIAPDIILSAAHCVGSFAHGADVGYYNPEHPGVRRDIVQQRRHPGYDQNRDILADDVYVMLLNESLSMTTFVSLNAAAAVPTDYSAVTVVGTGRQSHHGRVSDHLQRADLFVVPNDVCATAIGGVEAVLVDNDHVVCAGLSKDRESPCNGDSGGPLLQHDNNDDPQQQSQWQQVGIVSFGRECGVHTPSGFARVSHLYEWIRQQICDLSEHAVTRQVYHCPPSNMEALLDPHHQNNTTASSHTARILVEIQHASAAHETYWSIRSWETEQIVFNGPHGNPQDYDAEIQAVPGLEAGGQYRLEILDQNGSGMVGVDDQGNVVFGTYAVRCAATGAVLVPPTEFRHGDMEFVDFQVCSDGNDDDTDTDPSKHHHDDDFHRIPTVRPTSAPTAVHLVSATPLGRAFATASSSPTTAWREDQLGSNNNNNNNNNNNHTTTNNTNTSSQTRAPSAAPQENDETLVPSAAASQKPQWYATLLLSVVGLWCASRY